MLRSSDVKPGGDDCDTKNGEISCLAMDLAQLTIYLERPSVRSFGTCRMIASGFAKGGSCHYGNVRGQDSHKVGKKSEKEMSSSTRELVSLRGVKHA